MDLCDYARSYSDLMDVAYAFISVLKDACPKTELQPLLHTSNVQ